MRHTRDVIPALTMILVGCATGSVGGERQGSRVATNRLFADEIATRSHSNAYEAVESLRPRWLRERGQVSVADPRAGEVLVYLDGTRIGGAESLRQIRASIVANMEYLNASEATMRFGTSHAGGAILVSTNPFTPY